MKLAIFTSHPIQYQSPWFRSIEGDTGLETRIFYCFEPDEQDQGQGFAREFRWDLPLREGFDNQILKSIRLPRLRGGFFSRIATNLSTELRRFAPDVALVLGWHDVGLVQASLAARRLGIPLIFRGDSNGRRQRRWWVKAIQRRYVALAKAVLTIGSSNRDFYAGLGVPDSRMVRAPHFVDNARFVAEAALRREERAALREKWGIPQTAFCSLFAGKLEPKKRVGDFLEGVALARAAGVPVHALIVGSGEDMADAQRLVAQGAIAATFAGFLNQTEISQAYVAADALVLPSEFEAWGLVCNEAMACGTPAIVSNRVGCADDLVIDGVTGAVVPFGDPRAIAKVLTDWARHPDLHAAIADRARAHVLANYSISRSNRALLAAVRQITA